MMDKDLQAKVEAEIAALLPALTKAQTSWKDDPFEVTSAQGERTTIRHKKHLQAFADGRGWNALKVLLPVGSPAKYAIDDYVGPKGVGWVLRVSVVTAEGTWMRTINVGPEMGFEQGWAMNSPGET